MTTNKPTTYWAPSTALHKLASRHNNATCVLTDGPAEFNDVALVRLSDYEALQDECEKLRKAIRRLCNIYIVDDYYSGELREEMLDQVVERAVLRAKEDAIHEKQ